MYNAFFGFSQNPFNMSPDPSFLFRSSQHEEALANLIYGVQSHKGFVLLTGEVGTGKTTMLECLRDFLHSQQRQRLCMITDKASELLLVNILSLVWYSSNPDIHYSTHLVPAYQFRQS